MKITCGTDIIEISRIKEAFDSLGASFSNRIYTKKEIEYCESKKLKNTSIMQQDLQLKKQHLRQYQKV